MSRWATATTCCGGGEFCSLLRLVGYDDVLSIEHEDLMLPPLDGVRKSVELLRAAI